MARKAREAVTPQEEIHKMLAEEEAQDMQALSAARQRQVDRHIHSLALKPEPDVRRCVVPLSVAASTATKLDTLVDYMKINRGKVVDLLVAAAHEKITADPIKAKKRDLDDDE